MSVDDVSFVSSDTPWQRELRRRQSQWREARGYAIGIHEGRPLGSRLRMPDAEEQLWNFLTPAIGALARREYLPNAAGTTGQRKLYKHPRLFDDLLSSQPLVFNLLGELAVDSARATAAARRLWPGRVDTVTGIELEWSPGRGDRRYLGNGTAADAAIFHTTPSGGRGIIFIETKYHENLRARNYEVKLRHLEVARQSRAFLSDAVGTLRGRRLQQLWFDHLLVLATRETDALDSALFVVAYPEINERCRDAVAAYRATLDPAAAPTFEARTLEDVVSAIDEPVGSEWARAFRERYLTPSEGKPGVDAKMAADDIEPYVRLTDTPHGGLVLEVGVVRWPKPWSPEVEWRRYRVWRARPTEQEIEKAKMALAHDPRFFRVCRLCHARNNAGHMHGDHECQSCATKHFGVVY